MSCSRREFCGVMAGGTALLSVGLPGCGNDVNAAPSITASVIDDSSSDHYGQIPILVPRYPDLMAAGGAITVYLEPLAPATRPFEIPVHGVLLIHRGAPGDNNEYIAVQSNCPHAGCPLGYSSSDKLIECPCHASKFRTVVDLGSTTEHVGDVVHLPARQGLTAWAAAVDGDTVYIDLNTLANNDMLPAVVDGKVTLVVGQYPALQQTGGSLTGQPKGLADTLVVVRVSDSAFTVLSAICTHQSCTVMYAPGDKAFDCPCHGSVFDVNGKVQAGPAPAPLTNYANTFDGTTLTITVA